MQYESKRGCGTVYHGVVQIATVTYDFRMSQPGPMNTAGHFVGQITILTGLGQMMAATMPPLKELRLHTEDHWCMDFHLASSRIHNTFIVTPRSQFTSYT